MPDDPDAPLLAVLAAADAAEPRIVRADDDRPMVEARYEQQPLGNVERQVEAARRAHRSLRGVVDGDQARDVRRDLEAAEQALANARRRTRRDVGAVIT